MVDQAKGVVDQAFSVGRDLKDKAKDMAGSSTEAIKDQASEFVDAAKDVASQATDKFRQTVDGQKTAGAEYVGSLADTMRRAAREFDGDLPIAGTYMRKAASQVESVADTIKTGNFNDLVRGAQSFARRQPTAFLGIAVLAGFGVVRFLKSSADNSESGSTGGRQTVRRQIRTGRLLKIRGIAMTSPGSRSIPELFSDAVGQLGKLIGNEFELARAELSEKASQAGRAAGLIGAGAVFLIPALVLLLMAVAAMLISGGFSAAAAYFLTGAGAALVSGALIAIGLSRLSGDALKPTMTLEQVERDKIAAKEMVR